MRPAGKSCECEGCAAKRVQEAELDRREGARMAKDIKVWRREYHYYCASPQLKNRKFAPPLLLNRCETKLPVRAYANGGGRASRRLRFAVLHPQGDFSVERDENKTIVAHLGMRWGVFDLDLRSIWQVAHYCSACLFSVRARFSIESSDRRGINGTAHGMGDDPAVLRSPGPECRQAFRKKGE